ncbi:MAG: tagatose 1,6-diphosphate aldolase [Chloroflexi bacterium]|nr:tagatose 1,6-diphosphate aldolase [Chloroflexota bacterium]
MLQIGKYRHLTQCSTENGHFVILAIDHRANLKEKLDAVAPTPLTDGQFTAFKVQVMSQLLDHASAVLIDPVYGLEAGIRSQVITGRHGLLAPLEVTDYDLHPSQRTMKYIENWGVAAIKANGGNGVKLLLTYHPDSPDASQKQDEVARIVADCETYQIPFFLEPIAYSLDPNVPLTSAERRDVVVRSAARFSSSGVDVLKVEFPALPADDETYWESALAELDDACGDVPWALLSAGVNYDTFLRQVGMACTAGASGVIVGRTIWSDAIKLQGSERETFLKTTAKQRMAFLASTCAKYGHDWRQVGVPATSNVRVK